MIHSWWGTGPQLSWLLPPAIVAVGYLAPWLWRHRP